LIRPLLLPSFIVHRAQRIYQVRRGIPLCRWFHQHSNLLDSLPFKFRRHGHVAHECICTLFLSRALDVSKLAYTSMDRLNFSLEAQSHFLNLRSRLFKMMTFSLVDCVESGAPNSRTKSRHRSGLVVQNTVFGHIGVSYMRYIFSRGPNFRILLRMLYRAAIEQGTHEQRRFLIPSVPTKIADIFVPTQTFCLPAIQSGHVTYFKTPH
jgi:hypothetical protein